ncbi:MAG: serine/threonine protein kinase [Gloeocapsa sp. UFS-A4-WI-NPMV-4B04]|jgi:serine/threonine protein kinase|nr:serine/threonine protein kinase [Gloeocapsa sp. UFS-A4-WI-NPMV-4B04]
MDSQILGDRYQVQQQLAKKPGRRTLLARDLQTQELVVVKLLSFGSDFEWDALKLFEREVETLKTLSHTSIPRYLDYFELDSANGKGFALVQTYIAATSLEEHLKAGRSFSESEVKQLAKALLEILTYLHGRQPPVIHRDSKPSNILLGERSGNNVGQVYLVDFGSVQTLAAREGGTMTIVGTYGYMPPEQFGDRTVPASDLYSLGATLVTLVTGIHPADLPQKDGRIQFEQQANISPEFNSWLRWMTEPSLDRRLGSAKEALQALEQPPAKNTAPLVVKKPFGSKISLIKDEDSLEILMPRKGFSAEIVGLTVYAIAWNSFVVMWTGIAVFSVPFGVNIFFALFSLPFWGAGISMVWHILSTLFGRVWLCLDQQQIWQTSEIFGFNYKQKRPALRQDISRLQLEYLGDSRSRLIIWAGTQKYELGGYGHITEPELEWIAHELGDWLKVPIQFNQLPYVRKYKE